MFDSIALSRLVGKKCGEKTGMHDLIDPWRALAA
jgi:hypothetical protein